MTAPAQIQAPPRGCFMVNSLYVKANGELPCWDDVGESLILRQLQSPKLQAGEELEVYSFEGLKHIRRSFMEGRLPHPEICPNCAVLGQGSADSLTPNHMEVLHVESSYLCGLSCPQCIPAKLRRDLKGAPYNLSREDYEGLLKQLRAEGIDSVRFVHFEGRGDPLMCPWLGDLVALTRTYYPRALVMATTHGGYPYREWMLNLDVMRFSVDGASQETYEKYRIDGSFERAIALMRRLRDERKKPGSRLRVEWKYILFEHNDHDDEMLRAVELARELDADITFCLTHTPMHSQRFRTPESVSAWLEKHTGKAVWSSTFQMKSNWAPETWAVVAEHVDALLSDAIDAARTGESDDGLRLVKQALESDPGLELGDEPLSLSRLQDTVDSIVDGRPVLPATLSGVAGVLAALERPHDAARLHAHYLKLVPDAPNRRSVARFVAESLLVQAITATDDSGGLHLAVRGLSFDPGLEVSEPVELRSLLDVVPGLLEAPEIGPGTLSALAGFLSSRGEPGAGARLLERYLELAPEAGNADAARDNIAEGHLWEASRLLQGGERAAGWQTAARGLAALDLSLDDPVTTLSDRLSETARRLLAQSGERGDRPDLIAVSPDPRPAPTPPQPGRLRSLASRLFSQG